MTHPDWQTILSEPFVALVLGRRGTGKTALGHRLLEEFHAEDRDAYIINFPRSKRDLLPDWLELLPRAITYEHWPEDSITLVNEAHHLMHARRSLNAENLELDKLISLSRQRNADVVFDTQFARRLDVSGVMGASAIIFRYPSLMADDFERQQLRSLVREARDALDEYVEVVETDEYQLRDETDELRKRAYIFGEKFRGIYPHEIELPEHWCESISKAYGDRGPDQDMADIEDVTVKSVDEVQEELGDTIEEILEGAEEEEAADAGEATGLQFIEQMIESGNRVTRNPFSGPVVELIVPKEMEEEIADVIEENNLEPNLRDVVAQPPSFAESRPAVSDDLVAWQFLLEDAGDLDSSSYLLSLIVDELEDEPVIATTSRTVETSVF